MRAGTRGFVLLIVIAILGVLAMLAVQLSRAARTSMQLGTESTQATRARMVARSGFEAMIQEALSGASQVYRTTRTDPVGAGTFTPGGDVFSARATALEGRININDGVMAGQGEMSAVSGFTYDSSAIDPWPTPGLVTDDSALINLRLRRILNAYGDAHRYYESIFTADASLPNTNAGQSYTFTSTAAGLRGESMPALDSSGNPLTLPADIVADGTGLGDRIIANRPSGGYRTVGEIAPILDAWGNTHLTATYLDGRTFSEMAADDLTARGFVDMAFSRMAHEIGYLEPDYFIRTDYVPTYLDSDPPDLSNIWRPHATAPVNINAASLLVRAALYYAPVNVTYVGESNQTVIATPVTSGSYNMNRQQTYSMARPGIGVAGPVFRESALKENGYPIDPVSSPSPANVQRHRFMSLFDAFHLAKATGDWITANGWMRDFEDFEAMMAWKRTSSGAPDYERAQPAGSVYDPTFKHDPAGIYTQYHPDAGLFLQDYVEKTLPHVLSLNRRMPGYMGAPSALLSPVTILQPEFEWVWIIQYPPPIHEQGRFPDRKAEDFVWRFPHPKVKFLPSGRFHIRSVGTVSSDTTDWSSVIDTELELYSTTVVRSQRDLEAMTDGTTDAEIRVGPEFTVREGGVQSADSHIGFVGLKDDAHAPEGGAAPTIALDFDTDFSLSTASSQSTALPADETATSPHITAVAPHADNLIASTPEDSTASQFAAGADSADISPFGGVFLGSRGHGPYALDVAGNRDAFQDSLYWRLDSPGGLVDFSVPPGEQMRQGFVSFWFRIPTAHASATPVHFQYDDGSGWTNSARQMGGVTYHSLFNLVVWQRSRLATWSSMTSSATWTGPYDNPVSIEVGLRVDPWQNKRFIVSRINQPSSTRYSVPSFGVSPFGYLGVTPLPESPSVPVAAQTDFLHTPLPWAYSGLNQAYAYWKTRNRESYILNLVELKDIPEAGPGTWHRVGVGWDLTWNHTGPLLDSDVAQMLWTRVRNETCVANYYSEWGPSFVLGSTESGHPPIYDGHNTLSLGEVHQRWRVAVDQTLRFEKTFQTTKNEYFPAWRAETLIDNVRVSLGNVPAGYKGFNGTGFDSESDKSSRYDLASKPAWVVDPGLPQGSRLLAVASRVYFPPDSSGNVCDVDLDVLDPLGVPYTNDGPAAGDKVSGYFDTLVPAAGWKVRVQYTDQRRDGTGPLVTQSGLGGTGDDVTAIPWIHDLKLLHRRPGQMQILTWDVR